jgi:hypothetical protein
MKKSEKKTISMSISSWQINKVSGKGEFIQMKKYEIILD